MNNNLKLKDKHIILGITGSIAAYKAAHLIRLFIKEGAIVKIVVTPFAKEFITPVTLATLSKNTVLCDFFHHDDGAWNSHVELGLWADLMIVAPATANTIAKMAHGIADNMLLTTYLSVRCPVMVAPAMDTDMFQHRATQSNIELLKQRGVLFVEPPSGELASGLTGKGRMEEPENILKEVIHFFEQRAAFSGKSVLITAGPTHEYIDPVRFISNASSGKTGVALANVFAQQGATITLICGPIAHYPNHPNINIIKITSAEQMLEACKQHISHTDIAIFAAAVADYKPKTSHPQKLKKKENNLNIELEPTPDIAKEMGKLKKKHQFFVGFALETDNAIQHATEKLTNKQFDLIVLNTISEHHNPVGNNENSYLIIDQQNNQQNIPLQSKEKLAHELINIIKKYYK